MVVLLCVIAPFYASTSVSLFPLPAARIHSGLCGSVTASTCAGARTHLNHLFGLGVPRSSLLFRRLDRQVIPRVSLAILLTGHRRHLGFTATCGRNDAGGGVEKGPDSTNRGAFRRPRCGRGSRSYGQQTVETRRLFVFPACFCPPYFPATATGRLDGRWPGRGATFTHPSGRLEQRAIYEVGKHAETVEGETRAHECTNGQMNEAASNGKGGRERGGAEGRGGRR